MATFVLVHGAWAGGWIWKKIIPLVRAAGHDVHATTATGLGDRVHLADPAIDLDSHITDVANVLEFEELTDVTLVGWSYGGMIITGVAEQVPERLAKLVYLDANVPVDGENSYDAELYSEEARAADRDAAEAAGRPGFLVIDPYVEWIRSLTPDPADQTWLCAKLVPQPLATYTQPIRLGNPAAAAIPRAFVFCTEGKGDAAADPTVRNANRVRSAPGWHYRELGTPTWPRSTPRRRQPRRSCPWCRRAPHRSGRSPLRACAGTRPMVGAVRARPIHGAAGCVPRGDWAGGLVSVVVMAGPEGLVQWWSISLCFPLRRSSVSLRLAVPLAGRRSSGCVDRHSL